MTSRAGAAWPFHRSCPAAASSPGSGLRNTLLCENVHVHSYGEIDHGVILPYVDIGQRARLTNVIVDSGVRIPPGLVVGDDPELDAARFRRTERGICLITQSMLDRLGEV